MKPIRLAFLDNRRISITFRLTALYATILSLMILFLTFINFKVVQYLIVETNKAELTKSSENISSYLSEGGSLGPVIFDKVNLNPNLDIKIIDSGVVKYDKSSKLYKVDYASNLNTHQVVSSGHNYVLLNKKVLVGKKEIYMQLALDMDTSSEFLEVMYQSLFGINIAGVIFSILSGIYITKRTLKPIEEIAKTARNITINDLNQRIDTSGPDDELKELARTFNNMVDRLQLSIEKQKQFISDASHELRTPIAVIQGYIRLLERWGKKDMAVLDESIEAIRSESENMKRLFEQLLQLAQADSGQLCSEFENFRIDKLVDDIVKQFRLIAIDHMITLETKEPLEVYADKTQLQQLIRIVLDNSVKYTPPHTQIVVEVEEVGLDIQLRIADNGPGISTEDLPFIFDRFYRAEKSRSKLRGGTGLGLSIAKWIVECHEGTICVDSDSGQGTCVKVTLPQRILKRV